MTASKEIKKQRNADRGQIEPRVVLCPAPGADPSASNSEPYPARQGMRGGVAL